MAGTGWTIPPKPFLKRKTAVIAAAVTEPVLKVCKWKRVAQVVSGDFGAAALTFDQCVMCNLCTLSCPKHIRPNHLGLFARRMKAARTLRPVDLMRRLREIDSGKMKVEFEEESV